MALTEPQLLDLSIDHTVQQLPKVDTPTANINRIFASFVRGPLLPAHGTREREKVLSEFWNNDFNTLFNGGISGLGKRVSSTPWQIIGDPKLSSFFQAVFMNADFGRGWDVFIGKLVTDYSRYDAGAYIEVIGQGDPLQPITGPIAGLSVLDSLRCLPTGDPEFPVVYMDVLGVLHVLHHTRVIRFVDGLETDETSYGYGQCSLTRAIAAVSRDILINRYVQMSLDDNPSPGIMIFKNITTLQLANAIKTMEQERSTDFGGEWGRVIKLFGLMGDSIPEVESVSFSETPDKFDLEKAKQLNAREIALSIGLDIQDIWELQGGNIGSGTQSEILHQKSKGKALGRLLKGLERTLNLSLPRSVEFEFKYRDPDEDQQRADLAVTWVTTVLSLDNKLTPNQQLQLLANQVEGIRDVITDKAGQLIRVDDSDPKTPEQEATVTAPAPIGGAVISDKALADTQSAFKLEFTRLVQLVQAGSLSEIAVKPALRLELIQRGTDAFIDGLKEGGSEQTELGEEGRKILSIWRAEQRHFLNKFVKEIFAKDFLPQQIANRADMWVNKSLNTMFYQGLRVANKEQRYMWVVDVLKEHCITCLKLNGQIHRMKTYLSRNLLPQASTLVCGGFNCGCRLQKTQEKARGSLRAVRFVRIREG